jgi:hypothetical protein
MKSKEQFDHTLKILVAAYLNGSLAHSNCHACAVGNIIAANLDIRYDKDLKWVGRQVAWSAVFVTLRYQIAQNKCPAAYTGEAKVQIDATGYTWQELAALEYAFERAPTGNTSEDHTFNSLMAVVDVLYQIHQLDESTKTAVKSLFVKA